MRHRIYIDETGTDDLTHAANPEHRYLSLTGVIIHLDHVEKQATPDMNAIKERYFPLTATDPDDRREPVVFHRKEMVNKKGAFRVLQAPAVSSAFDSDLLRYLIAADYKVITVVLDKKAMLQQQHWREKHPYHYCMQILVEKYALWLQRHNSKGDVMAEERKGKKDQALIQAFDDVCRVGTRYAPSGLIQSRLMAKTLKMRAKKENITGLQIADLMAHPSCNHVLLNQRGANNGPLKPFANSIVDILVNHQKYDRGRDGTIPGYGTKYLP